MSSIWLIVPEFKKFHNSMIGMRSRVNPFKKQFMIRLITVSTQYKIDTYICSF